MGEGEFSGGWASGVEWVFGGGLGDCTLDLG